MAAIPPKVLEDIEAMKRELREEWDKDEPDDAKVTSLTDKVSALSRAHGLVEQVDPLEDDEGDEFEVADADATDLHEDAADTEGAE